MRPALAAAVLILASGLEVLERLDQLKRPLFALETLLLSHEGRKEETRCMVGGWPRRPGAGGLGFR
jgi:hypothetical protein